MHKPTVRRAFNRSAIGYDSVAGLQRHVCEMLLTAVPEIAPTDVLDAGCGTGYARGLLTKRWPNARLIAADFAQAMLVQAGGGVCADVESLPFAAGTIDFYWSSLTWQWCEARLAAAEAARVLRPGGLLAISSLADGTLNELRQVFSGTDRYRHVLDFASAQTLATACAEAGLTDVAHTVAPLRLHHASLKELLLGLKTLGANQVGHNRRPGLFGRKAWQTVEARYEALREADGLPATYEVILCTARKPAS